MRFAHHSVFLVLLSTSFLVDISVFADDAKPKPKPRVLEVWEGKWEGPPNFKIQGASRTLIPGAVVAFNSLTGKVARIQALDKIRGIPLKAGESPRVKVENFLRENSELMGLTPDLSNLSWAGDTKIDPEHNFTYNQVYQGLPVSGGRVSLNLNSEGTGVNNLVATIFPIRLPIKLELPNNPASAINAAFDAVKARVPDAELDESYPPKAELRIILRDGVPRAVWKIIFTTVPVRRRGWLFTIDAKTGTILGGAETFKE